MAMMGKAAKTSKEIQVGKEITDAGVKSKRFYTEPAAGDSGRPIFYFAQTGDYLKGILEGASNMVFKFYANRTYLIKVFEGRQDGADFVLDGDHNVEIVAYKDLRRIIEQNELMLSMVKIILAGKVRTGGGHYRYVWEVWKDTGTFFENEEQKTARPPRKRRKKGVKTNGRKTQSDKTILS